MRPLGQLFLISALLTGCVSAPLTVPVQQTSLDQVEKSLNEGDLTTAMAELQDLQSTRPDDPGVLRLAARLYMLAGNKAALQEATEQLLAIAPADAYALEQLGLLRLSAGDLQSAENFLTLAVAEEPSRWMAWNGLGVIADGEARFGDARNRFRQALEIVPGHPKVLANLGWSRLLAGDADEAEQLLRQSLNLAPDSLVTQSNLAFCLAMQGRYEEAMTLYENRYERPVAANNVGYAALLRKDAPSARKYLSMALELRPSYYRKAANNLASLER